MGTDRVVAPPALASNAPGLERSLPSRQRVSQRSEVLADAVRVLRTCEIVLGGSAFGMAVCATVAAVLGGASGRTALLLWTFLVVNFAWTRVANRSRHIVLVEFSRAVVALPLVVCVYLTRGGYFEGFWLPATLMVVGQSVLWGCLTGRGLRGYLVTAAYASAIFLAGAYATAGLHWGSVRVALGIAVTGFMLSFVSAQLGRSLRDARRRRDEAEEHRLALSAAFDELTSAQQHLDAVLECAPGVIVAVDPKLRVEFVNRVAAPFDKTAVIGQSVLDLIEGDARRQFERALRAVLASGGQDDLELRQTGPEHSDTWYAVHIGAMRRGASVAGAVVVAQDVTQLKRTQAEVVGAQRMVAVGTLAAGIAHEINTPIQFVSDSTHFLRDAARELFEVLDALQVVRRLAEEQAAPASLSAALARARELEARVELPYLLENVPTAFETCVDGLERVTTIVHSMKEFAHPPRSEMAAVDLNHAIRSTLAIARNEFKYVADLETDFGELPPVTCYVSEINQVVLNLVVNAAHAIEDVVRGTDARGTIRIETRRDGEDVIVSVGDTGSGIPDAARGRIFEPFFTTKDVGKGTGQGLALAWTVVKEKHGGDISFRTELGSGTTFVVRLPIAGKERSRRVSAVPPVRTLSVTPSGLATALSSPIIIH